MTLCKKSSESWLTHHIEQAEMQGIENSVTKAGGRGSRPNGKHSFLECHTIPNTFAIVVYTHILQLTTK